MEILLTTLAVFMESIIPFCDVAAKKIVTSAKPFFYCTAITPKNRKIHILAKI
jgi:hypothetical protein